MYLVDGAWMLPHTKGQPLQSCHLLWSTNATADAALQFEARAAVLQQRNCSLPHAQTSYTILTLLMQNLPPAVEHTHVLSDCGAAWDMDASLGCGANGSATLLPGGQHLEACSSGF